MQYHDCLPLPHSANLVTVGPLSHHGGLLGKFDGSGRWFELWLPLPGGLRAHAGSMLTSDKPQP